MCDFGISAAIIGIVGTVISTTMGVVSSVQSANSQKAQYNYQAQVAKKNQQIAQNNADQKRQEGIEEARMQRLKSLQAIGAQQTAMAANGIDVTQGTALDVIEDTSAKGELDALTTRYNYESQALAYEQQADNFENQSSLDVLAGQNAYKSGMLNAAGAGFKGLGDASSVASKWYSSNSIGGAGKSSGKKVSGGISGDMIAYV